jgi:hypothetical protein
LPDRHCGSGGTTLAVVMNYPGGYHTGLPETESSRSADRYFRGRVRSYHYPRVGMSPGIILYYRQIPKYWYLAHNILYRDPIQIIDQPSDPRYNIIVMFRQLSPTLSVLTEPTWVTLDDLGKTLPNNPSVRAY